MSRVPSSCTSGRATLLMGTTTQLSCLGQGHVCGTGVRQQHIELAAVLKKWRRWEGVQKEVPEEEADA